MMTNEMYKYDTHAAAMMSRRRLSSKVGNSSSRTILGFFSTSFCSAFQSYKQSVLYELVDGVGVQNRTLTWPHSSFQSRMTPWLCGYQQSLDDVTVLLTSPQCIHVRARHNVEYVSTCILSTSLMFENFPPKMGFQISNYNNSPHPQFLVVVISRYLPHSFSVLTRCFFLAFLTQVQISGLYVHIVKRRIFIVAHKCSNIIFHLWWMSCQSVYTDSTRWSCEMWRVEHSHCPILPVRTTVWHVLCWKPVLLSSPNCVCVSVLNMITRPTWSRLELWGDHWQDNGSQGWAPLPLAVF